MKAEAVLHPVRNVLSGRLRLAAIGFVMLGVLAMIATNNFLSQRFTETLRNESQLRAALYSGNMVTLLRQQSLVPLLLAQDPTLISALQSKDYTNTSQRLIDLAEDIRADSISLVDVEGRVVASSDRRQLGENLAELNYFNSALREQGTVFSLSEFGGDAGPLEFTYANKVQVGLDTLGVVVVFVNMRQMETIWRNRNDVVAVTDASDRVILASNPFWRNNTLTNVLASEPPPTSLRGTLGFRARNTAEENPVAYFGNTSYLRNEVKTGFRGWRLTYFATFDAVRARVNAFLALELMALALLIALFFYLANKRLERQSKLIVEESDQLRMLNARLSREIEERQKVERSLKTAEQSLEQASKLAALGQMSAAVSHELNQPLAAMRTYIAGSRLLMQRNRSEEALAGFKRVDDLIDRMGAITRQLKSYARKGTEDLIEVDLRDAVDGSLSMMTPQLSKRRVEVRKTMPTGPASVMADPVRLDQIIVNLLRNAIEAMEDEDHPVLDILLVLGDQVSLSIRDNGHGLEDPDALFEPFYTTKEPGKGVGLGLAISAGIAKELGGRLLARKAEPRGAIFELRLPRANASATKAAE